MSREAVDSSCLFPSRASDGKSALAVAPSCPRPPGTTQEDPWACVRLRGLWEDRRGPQDKSLETPGDGNPMGAAWQGPGQVQGHRWPLRGDSREGGELTCGGQERARVLTLL